MMFFDSALFLFAFYNLINQQCCRLYTAEVVEKSIALARIGIFLFEGDYSFRFAPVQFLSYCIRIKRLFNFLQV